MTSESKNLRSHSLRSQGHSLSLRSKQSEDAVVSGGVASMMRSEDFLDRHRLGASTDAEDARSFYAVVS